MGDKNKERISIYLDSSNVFTFSIQDLHGESHVLRIETGSKGIPLNKPFILSYIFGIRKTTSYLKIFINHEQCGSLELPFIVDFNKISVQGGVIGADIDGKNGAKIDVYEITSYNNTPTTKEFEKLVDYLQKKERKACVSFTEKQFMNIGKKQ